MKDTTTGSKEHKAEFFDRLERTIQENLWKLEVKRHSMEQLLESLSEGLKTIQVQVAAKEFPTAGAGRNAVKAKEKEMAEVQAEIMTVNGLIGQQLVEMESIKRYREGGSNANTEAEKSN